MSFESRRSALPLAAAPLLDGQCNDAGYGEGVGVQLKPYGDVDENQANVQLLRTSDHLWVCFSGLITGTEIPGAYVGVRADIDNSRDSFSRDHRCRFLRG